MNKMSTERRAAILSALVEGNSIASTCRMLGVNKVTVLRLLEDAGTMALRLHNDWVRRVTAERVQVDEVWAFCYCKAKNIPEEHRGEVGYGDVWTWTAMDADTKLMIGWYVSADRTAKSATTFLKDVAARVVNRIQLPSDGLRSYLDGVYSAFGNNIDHAVLHKQYANDGSGGGRYSPPVVVGIEKQIHCGNPDPEHISTSLVERSNLTARMSMRRFTRLTNGFSKKLENHEHAIALHHFHYNFIRKHQSIKTTPAVMAGLTDKQWTMVEFVQLMEREERVLGCRVSEFERTASSWN